MLAKRIIPCLDVKDGRVVKGINFLGLQDVGDAVELGRRYALEGADELVYLDISATLEGRKTFAELVARVGEAVNIPFPLIVCHHGRRFRIRGKDLCQAYRTGIEIPGDTSCPQGHADGISQWIETSSGSYGDTHLLQGHDGMGPDFLDAASFVTDGHTSTRRDNYLLGRRCKDKGIYI